MEAAAKRFSLSTALGLSPDKCQRAERITNGCDSRENFLIKSGVHGPEQETPGAFLELPHEVLLSAPCSTRSCFEENFVAIKVATKSSSLRAAQEWGGRKAGNAMV